MKTRFLLIGILALMMATGCADRDWEPTTDRENPATTRSGRQRTLEEALVYADEWFAQMDEPTRGEGRRVGSVHYVQSTTRTRSGDADTLMYLVNYADNQGFALLGRPATSKAIYAISEEGSLDMSDTLYNKPLAMFMASAREDSQLGFTMPNPPVTPPWDKLAHPIRVARQVSPMLPENVAKWSQESPYNRDCPYVDGKKGLVGCGPLAVGMLMAYYQYPKKLGNVNIDWNAVVQYNLTPTISTILNTLASKQYLNSTYTAWDNRTTEGDSINPTFERAGFDLYYIWKPKPTPLNYTTVNPDTGQKTERSNVESLMDFMQYGYGSAEAAPVILWGKSLETVGDNNEPLKHFWVTDGVIQYEEYEPDLPGFIPIKQNPSFHMVWGWGGNANGYYTYFESKQQLGVVDKDSSGLDESVHFWNLFIFGRYEASRD